MFYLPGKVVHDVRQPREPVVRAGRVVARDGCFTG
ncbi:hypothetical protein BX285_6089 [Streptomyces sp. 1114.5]|nr:hypothetical protein BX285_6089 [Streptomyces sp. 1114.5]